MSADVVDPGPESESSRSSGLSGESQVTPATSAADPERGLRGAMSAALVLEALTVLLAIPVATNTGSGVGPAGVAAICLLAALLVACCAIVRRPYAFPVILGLQVVMIGCWLITPPLGVMGVVFLGVWLTIGWFRREFRRRQAAGTLPGPIDPGDA
jgi:Protein of unknown function (DUF4233)